MGFTTAEILREDIVELVGATAVLFEDEELIAQQEYAIEILEQPILEELEVRIEYAEIKSCKDECPDEMRKRNGAERSKRRTDMVVEEVMTEKILPEKLHPFWSYIGRWNSNFSR